MARQAPKRDPDTGVGGTDPPRSLRSRIPSAGCGSRRKTPWEVTSMRARRTIFAARRAWRTFAPIPSSIPLPTPTNPRPPPCPEAGRRRSTPVPCIPRSARQAPGTAPSAAWRWNRSRSRPRPLARVHLPHAPGDRAGRTGVVPHLWDGPGASRGDPGEQAKPGTGGHDPPVLGGPRPCPPGGRARDGRPSGGPPRLIPPRVSGWLAVRPGHPGGAVGGLALLRPRLGVRRHGGA